MVVCRFFQQGYCRYGQNCRFDHIYGNRYNYHVLNTQPQATVSATTTVTDDQLVKQVQTDIQSAIKGGQWLLSSYAPYKGKPQYPGITDLSPEEARLFIYEAKANNTIDQAIAYINKLSDEARFHYSQLLDPDKNIIKVLRNLYDGKTEALFQQNTNTFSNSNNASSLFRSATQNAPFGQTQSVFGLNSNAFGAQTAGNSAPQSIFSQANQNIFGNQTQTPSVFGSQNSDQAKSVFTQATQNVFGSRSPQNQSVFGNIQQSQSMFANTQSQGQSVFGSTQTQPQSVFGVPQAQTQSVFGAQNNPSSVSQSFFEQPKQQPFSNQKQGVFQIDKPTIAFGGNVFEQSPNDDGIYSKMEDLSPDDLEMFQSSDFKLGFIPEIPPPRALCI